MFDIIGEYFGEIVIGATFLGVTWLFKGILKESLIEFAKLAWDKDKIKDTAINSVLSIEANKWHGHEVEGTPPTVKATKPFVDAEASEAMDSQLLIKYNDVSNKYNEILELVSASHHTIGQLMVEIVDFKAEVNEFIKDSSFRTRRLENFNLTPSQVKEYKEDTV